MVEVPTLNKINTLDDLRNLSVGDEVLIMHGKGASDNVFTVHGRVQTTLKPDYLLTLGDYVELPVKFKVEPFRPSNVLDFLRGLNDPRYVRQKEPKVYDIGPRETWEMYSVNSRTI